MVYKREASLAKEFHHLTTDNYQEYMDKNGLVAFYLRCEKERERERKERGSGRERERERGREGPIHLK